MKSYATGRGWELYHGDCFDILPNITVSDAAIFDPPFTAAGGSTNGRSGGRSADVQFFEYWFRDICAAWQTRVHDHGCAFTFCDWRTIASVETCMRGRSVHQRKSVWSMSQALVWDRKNIGLGSPFRNRFEMIAFSRGPVFASNLPKNIGTVIEYPWPYGVHKYHGAEKPVDLCRMLVRWALNGSPTGRILDPFMGSGSVGVAALLETAVYIGIECEEYLCEIAARKLRAAGAAGEQLTMPVAPSSALAQVGLFGRDTCVT